MIRIFITAVLYLISMFTQAQENSKQGFQQSNEPTITINSNESYLKDSKETVYFPLYVSEEGYGFTNKVERYGSQGLTIQNLR